MKKMLLIIYSIIFITVSLLNAAPDDFANVEIAHGNQVVRSGDYIDVKGSNFVHNDKVRYVLMTMLDANNRIVKNVVLEEYDLQIDESGILDGRVKLEKIYTTASKFHLLIFTENTNVQNSNSLISIGSDSEPPPVILDVGSATIDDPTPGGNNDDIADPGETLTISGSDWGNNTLIAVTQMEYTDLAGTVFNRNIAFASTSVTLSGGVLSGTVTTTDPYATGTQSLRANVFTFNPDLGIPESALSNVMPTPDIIRPNLDSAYAYAIDTIRVFFDEPVQEVGGDAAGKFIFNQGGVSATSLVPVGSSPSDTWNVVISGLTDRGLGGLTIAYSSTQTGPELQDPYGNEVYSTSPAITFTDGIQPDITQLRTADDLNTLSVCEFLGSTSYTLRATVQGGTSDGSLDG
ncbi:hypothetical protein AC481_00350, partial [miscellaneous Crenarchaeota group archaeon SMTZ-80]